MERAQKLLYTWLKEVGEVSYERIKQTCIYLNTKFDYSLEKPIHHFFYPLLYYGVVEFSGNGKFCLAPGCVISKGKSNHIIINSEKNDSSLAMACIGIQISKSDEMLCGKNRYNFSLESMLTQIPTIESCVLKYQQINNVNPSDFVNSNVVSKKKNDSQRWYFLDSQNGIYYAIPHQSINPDAINIATCYGRVVDSEYNGIYDVATKQLKMSMYRMPILLYRLLMIESLFYGEMPYIDKGYYVFNNISRKAYIELNRVLCNSIKTNPNG